MSQFSSVFWDWAIAIVSVVSIIACGVLLRAMSVRRVAPGEAKTTTGHTWDEDLGEYNYPLPAWWIWLFYITIVFSLAYLVFYPGLGSYRGTLEWSSNGQYDDEVKQAERDFGPLYAKFAGQDLKVVASDPDAHAMGQRLFLNNCAQCHGSDGGGGKGFPNLTDETWLFGGDPDTIKTTILSGRHTVMPAWAKVLGDEGVKDAASYVRSLSGLPHEAERAKRGQATFKTTCIACHGPEGKGNQALGAPNLTDKVWEYGSSEGTIIESIGKGRAAEMPAHGAMLGEAKVHLLAAYVWSLSKPPGK